MGKTTKRNVAVAREFSKLEMLLLQTASDTLKCLKILKRNLGKYDRRHGLYFRNTSKYFMRNDIRVAKDTTTDLRHVAKRIKRSKSPTASEINAARISMNATADAMNDLKQAGRIFDQNNGASGGVTGIIDNILNGNNNEENANQPNGGHDDKNPENQKPKRGLFGRKKGGGFLKASDTVEAVVKSTLNDSFGGFAALKQQITLTENALSPSIATRAKDAVVDVASKIVGDSSPSPTQTA
ncbi:hypothetical protein L917_19611 [Phytophthora nicotianae]|uniref:Uncharacterized protein n=2 Tax=Phytophthora nicotianae TaxID=4792 RepID=V9E124_PHYNI|nr:hypothetical protein F443_20437 [Phytophthora nicotianae P1569]ETL79818.1 hypothetical protein L917_19611 [Phytophthora nicotianae]